VAGASVNLQQPRASRSAGALAMLAAGPAARPALTLLELLLRSTDAPGSGRVLLGILDPADELVASEWRDVPPEVECRGVGDQRLAQVCRKAVDDPTGHTGVAHAVTVAVDGLSSPPGSGRAQGVAVPL
jgi:hypothetical protein